MRYFDFSFLKQYQSSSLDMIIISTIVGIIFAIFAIIYQNLVLGSFIRKLIEKKAFSEQSAVTLNEIKYNNIFIKFALRDNSTFRKTVHSPETDSSAEKRYFIPEANYEREKKRYSKKGTGIVAVLLAIAVFMILGLIALNIIPYFTGTLKNIVS